MRRRTHARSRVRKNPQLLTAFGNPVSSRSLARAMSAYEQFHGVRAKEALRVGRGRGVLIMIGMAKEIIYKPRRGIRKGPAFYHKITSPVALAATPDGKKVFFVPLGGSRFRWDPRYGLMD